MAMKLVPPIVSDALRNLFRRPQTVAYPKEKPVLPDKFRGKIWVNDKCISCGACVRACPALAIKLEKEQISVWTMRCINCARCVEVCPVNAINYSDECEVVSADRNESYVRRYTMAKCASCGKEFANIRQIEYIAEKSKQPIEKFLSCPDCKKKAAAQAPAQKEGAQKPQEK
jgi:hydrogenase-4 component H